MANHRNMTDWELRREQEHLDAIADADDADRVAEAVREYDREADYGTEAERDRRDQAREAAWLGIDMDEDA